MGSVLVIGAGVTGVSAALWLARDGSAVTLIDRQAPGAPGQASFGNGGLLARGSILPPQTPGLALRAPSLLFGRDAPLFLRPAYLPRLLPWLVRFLRNGAAARLDRIVPALWALTRDTVADHCALACGTAAEALIERGPYAHLFPDPAAFAREAPAWRRKTAAGLPWEPRLRRSTRGSDRPTGTPQFCRITAGSPIPAATSRRSPAPPRR